MSGWLLLVTVFAVTFLAELPDKSLFASLVPGTRYRPAQVWLGVAAAFAVHVTLSVAAGGLLTLAPESVIDCVSCGVVPGRGDLAAAVRDAGRERAGTGRGADGRAAAGLPAGCSPPVFTVVFIGEWGDVTQITTANFVARYSDPLIIGVAALAAL